MHAAASFDVIDGQIFADESLAAVVVTELVGNRCPRPQSFQHEPLGEEVDLVTATANNNLPVGIHSNNYYRNRLIRNVPCLHDWVCFDTNVVIIEILKKGLRPQMLFSFRGRSRPKHLSSLIILMARQGYCLGPREKCCTVSRLGSSRCSAEAWPLECSCILV